MSLENTSRVIKLLRRLRDVLIRSNLGVLTVHFGEINEYILDAPNVTFIRNIDKIPVIIDLIESNSLKVSNVVVELNGIRMNDVLLQVDIGISRLGMSGSVKLLKFRGGLPTCSRVALSERDSICFDTLMQLSYESTQDARIAAHVRVERIELDVLEKIARKRSKGVVRLLDVDFTKPNFGLFNRVVELDGEQSLAVLEATHELLIARTIDPDSTYMQSRFIEDVGIDDTDFDLHSVMTDETSLSCSVTGSFSVLGLGIFLDGLRSFMKVPKYRALIAELKVIE